MDKLFTKIGVAFGASVAVNESVNLGPLWTALITLAVSIISVLTVEGVAWLKAWFTAKKKNLEIKQSTTIEKEEAKVTKEKAQLEAYQERVNEADEVVEAVEAQEKED